MPKSEKYYSRYVCFSIILVFVFLFYSGHFSLDIVCFIDKEEGAGEILILHLDSLQYHQSTRIFEIITW